MKKILNSPQSVVTEMLKGIRATNPHILLDEENNVIYRANPKMGKVGLVSGGGSGHEPAHAGYVGEGMLDAAVAGNVFASPDPYKVLSGIKHADCGSGVLLIVKNYSGDIMNFEMASELAREEDINVEAVIVNDDVSIKEKESRRGIAGTVFVHKIAGACAEKGGSLENVKLVANKVINNLRSFGISLSSCTIPEVGHPIFQIADDEIELGMGIHGEPGVERVKLLSSKEIAQVLINNILNDDVTYEKSEVAILLNGLGSTTLMELYILVNDVIELLNTKDIKSVRFYVGNYMTSIEMSGVSLSLLRLDNELKSYLDDKCETPAFKVL